MSFIVKIDGREAVPVWAFSLITDRAILMVVHAVTSLYLFT